MTIQTEDTLKSIVAYKGFDRNMKCRGFQYEVGRTYTHDGSVVACSSGFHACETLIDVFAYYDPASSRFAEVELSGKSDREEDEDSKVCAASITVTAEISLPDFIERAVRQIVEAAKDNKEKTGYRSVATNTGYLSAATNTGDQSAATNTGYQSAATNTGERSVATNTGYQSVATNTGYRSVATNTGNLSAAMVSGPHSTAIATGFKSRVMAEVDGCGLYAEELEWNGSEYEIKSNASGVTGRRGIVSGVYYRCVSGQLVEAPQ